MVCRNSSIYSVLFLTLLFLVSCRNLDQRFAVKPNALGKSNEITVICDEEVPGAALWDSLEYYFTSAYPVMPQPEPVFDLRHFTPGQLEADILRRELRTYLVLADLSDTESPATQMTIRAIGEEAANAVRSGAGFGTHLARDRWAEGQLIFFLYGYGEEKLAEGIRDKFTAIASRIREHDREQLDAATYLNGINGPLIDSLQSQLGIGLKIPGEYKLASKKNGIFWLRSEFTESSHNLVITRFDYSDQQQLSNASIREWRDSTCLAVVRTRTPGSVMYINDQDLPLLFYNQEIKGHFTREMRGVWEMSRDYMGGPFVTYLILSKDQRTVYFIDAWIYAPGKEKRDYMQRLEHIVSSIGFQR